MILRLLIIAASVFCIAGSDNSGPIVPDGIACDSITQSAANIERTVGADWHVKGLTTSVTRHLKPGYISPLTRNDAAFYLDDPRIESKLLNFNLGLRGKFAVLGRDHQFYSALLVQDMSPASPSPGPTDHHGGFQLDLNPSDRLSALRSSAGPAVLTEG